MADRRPIEVDDLYRMKMVTDPDVNPDGRTIAFAVTTLDRDANGYKSEIWTVDRVTGDLQQLTNGLHRDTNPKWSPDGNWLAFTSDREPDDKPKGQLWLLPASGGEPHRLTTLENGVEYFAWSPDSSRLTAVSKVQETKPDPESDVKVIRTIRFRFDGEGYLEDKYRQIFVVDVETGDSTQLTSGPFEHYAPSWSQSGYEIAYAANLDEGWEMSPYRDLHVIRPDGGKVRRLTDGTGSWSQPVWSHDGTTIVCFGTRNVTSDSPRTEIFVVPAGGGAPESITDEFDRSFSDGLIGDIQWYRSQLSWSADDQHLYATYADQGSVQIGEINVANGTVTPLTGGRRRIGGPTVSASGDLVYAGCSAVEPGEIYTSQADGSKEQQLTFFNDPWRDEIEISEPAPFTVESEDGTPVHGWIMKPVGFEEGKTYPAVLEIHGGPFGMYGESFMFEFQLFASKGYAVIFGNPRGSTGYGDEFAHALHLKWGIADFPDQMALVDQAIEQGFVDPDRLGVLGGSYGGFMTNWMIGHTDRFRAACTQRCLAEMISAMYVDDIFFAASEQTFGADFWEDPEIFWDLSPMKYVNEMTTPLLIIHSEEDYRCPISQAELMFNALKKLGRETELVRFAGESHGLSRSGKPKNRVKRLEYITGWFDRYLQPA